jgi:hypothetical protein
VENQPGANATIGLVTVAKSPPDGHTIGLTSMVHYMVPFFSKNMPYDTLRDFTPIAPIAVVNDIVAVNPSVPVKTIQELIDHLFVGRFGRRLEKCASLFGCWRDPNEIEINAANALLGGRQGGASKAAGSMLLLDERIDRIDEPARVLASCLASCLA